MCTVISPSGSERRELNESTEPACDSRALRRERNNEDMARDSTYRYVECWDAVEGSLVVTNVEH